jgi:hypothetical protein
LETPAFCLTIVACQVIGKYIDDVEALGDIGSFNMNEIARVIAKNRSLYVYGPSVTHGPLI